MTPNRAAWGFGTGAATALLVMAVLPRFLFGFLSPTLPATQPFLPAANRLGLLLTMTCTLVGFLLPHLLGGAVVGAALESE